MMSLPHGKKVLIPWGVIGPLGIGPATILGQFHGQVSRDTNLLPITYVEWPSVSDGEKEALVAAIWFLFLCLRDFFLGFVEEQRRRRRRKKKEQKKGMKKKEER
ncbi:hypothetical protein LINPERPRIM_LOCUS11073, partial [Linum perenne]